MVSLSRFSTYNMAESQVRFESNRSRRADKRDYFGSKTLDGTFRQRFCVHLENHLLTENRVTYSNSTNSGIVDVENLLRHVGSDYSLLDELATMFRENYPGRIAVIRRAIHDGDGLRVGESAHQLKGAISNFHAPTVVEAVLRVEFAGRHGKLKDASHFCDCLESEIERLCVALSELSEAKQD
jgi:HPt (histidine-containing phosphotransfer) domain-containing protein